MMSQLRGSQHYIWSLADVLGQGATGAVYKARHKQTGELYAVKTFNQMSYMRSPLVQKREFDVLQRLNHENIVRLLAIEEETSSHTEVLVMELCTGGSLYGLLDDPENAYGIEEDEFQQVLIDVASGMKHLRDLEIVHRDIKPGNIMRYINEDGRSIYKLIDFGAARELQDEEQFVSLYGTEEYLFPDMYERAVLRRPTGKQFSASVDLWSLGVTLYHVATGQLPFRPFGGRKNKEIMYRITSEKKRGIISGVQHSEGGPIEWGRSLPSTCRLSQGMKQLITPVLAQLLESDHEKMMKFDDFFEEVKVITSKHVIYAFDLSKNSLLHIYINKNEQLAQFQELLAEQADVRREDQQLLFENHDFEKLVKPLHTASTYPHTSAQNPIYLFSDVRSLIAMSQTCNIPVLPPFPADVSLENDALLAKNCCAIIHYIRRLIIDAHLKQQLITKAAKMYLLVMVREIEHIKDSVVDFSLRVEETGKRLNLLADTGGLLMSTVMSVIQAGSNEVKKKCQIDNLNNILQWNSVSNQKENFSKLKCEVQTVKQQIESLNSQVSNEVLLWLDSCKCEESQNCIPKADILVSSTKTTVADFARDRTLKKLSFNEEQIHKFDKHKMKAIYYSKAATFIQGHCYPKTKDLFEQFHTWYSKVCKVQGQLQTLKAVVDRVSEWQSLLTDNLSQVQNERQLKLKALLSDLGIALTLPDTLTAETGGSSSSSSFDFVLRSKSNKEVRELLSSLKHGVLKNSQVTIDAKHMIDENEILLRRINQGNLEDEPKNMAPNCTNEELATLTAD